MASTTDLQRPQPWWIAAKAPWTGRIFERMILQPGDPREERVQRIRTSLLPRYRDGKRRLSMAKSLLITRAYQESEGLHPALRRALATERIFREIPIDLLPEQLLMGTASSGPHRVDLYVALFRPSTADLAEHGEIVDPLAGADEKYVFLEEDKRLFVEEIWPYWRRRCRAAYVIAELKHHYPEAWHSLRFGQCYDPIVGAPLYHTIQDYATVLAKGLNGLKAEIRGYIAELDAANPGGMEEFERRNQYEAMLIAADGLITYARRNAELAERLAAKEPDAKRAAELREMARICYKVPAEPADTWWEALQSFHFLRLGTAMAEDGDSHSAGRMDQWLLPYLQRDLERGRTTLAEAQELLECLFLKWNETHAFTLAVTNAGVGNNDKINLGGIDEWGRDCTNELSYMLLEAYAHVHLNDPNLSVRLHRNTPDEFLQQVLEVVRLGGGLPILINDEAIVPALVSRCGVALEHARHYGDVGCQENVTDPNMTGADANGRTNAGWFNIPKPVELALFDGVNPLNGVQVGPRTGDPRTFATMDEFVTAVRAQYEHAVAMNVIANNVSDFTFARYFPSVVHNLLHPGPRRSGIDINAGGCRYNWTGALMVGMANAGDMLAAIDTLIYRRREVTWDELLAALRANWLGFDELRRKCIAAPKYGCDDEYADGWTKTALDMLFAAYERHTTPRGGRFVCGLISMATYLLLGKRVGATPDGRASGEPLADATSPSALAPLAGPTAAHRSNARAIDAWHTPNGVTFNQRFNATAVTTPRELSKWADLVRTHVEAGGQSVQYNVVDSAVLRAAQRHPERYRDLIVRVGGYSAVFTELSQEVQDSIIARAEQVLEIAIPLR